MPRSNNPKMTLARKMMTKFERETHVPPFHCEAWNKRFRARQARVLAKQEAKLEKQK